MDRGVVSKRPWASPVSHMNVLHVRRGVAEAVSKILSVVLVLTVVHVGLNMTGETISYYADVEVSSGNLLVADPLGFTLSIASDKVDMTGRSARIVPTLTPNEDSEPLQYSVAGHMTSGDEAFCNRLAVVSTTSLEYTGPISTLMTGMSTTTGEIPMDVTLIGDEAPPENAFCFIELAFTARNADAPQGAGYYDRKILILQFFVPASAPDPVVVPFASLVVVDEGTNTPLTLELDTPTTTDTQGEEAPASEVSTTEGESLPAPDAPEAPLIPEAPSGINLPDPVLEETIPPQVVEVLPVPDADTTTTQEVPEDAQ